MIMISLMWGLEDWEIWSSGGVGKSNTGHKSRFMWNFVGAQMCKRYFFLVIRNEVMRDTLNLNNCSWIQTAVVAGWAGVIANVSALWRTTYPTRQNYAPQMGRGRNFGSAFSDCLAARWERQGGNVEIECQIAVLSLFLRGLQPGIPRCAGLCSSGAVKRYMQHSLNGIERRFALQSDSDPDQLL